MFDTRSFSSSTPAGSLATRNFVVGGHKRLLHAARLFTFGYSEHLDEKDVNDAVLKLLHIEDDMKCHSQRKYRDIVLIGHGLRSDLLILRGQGIMFEDISTIVGKLDTTYLAKEILGTNFRLRGLLRTLNCPFKNLHNAGNDANYALRAFLLLAYYGLRASASSRETLWNFTYLKTLALEPLPDTTQRNASVRALVPHCEDFTLNALDVESLSFFE